MNKETHIKEKITVSIKKSNKDQNTNSILKEYSLHYFDVVIIKQIKITVNHNMFTEKYFFIFFFNRIFF